MDDYKKQLATQSNEDETNRLETKLKSIERIAKTANSDGKDLLRDDENRLAKEIEESIEREKKNT